MTELAGEEGAVGTELAGEEGSAAAEFARAPACRRHERSSRRRTGHRVEDAWAEDARGMGRGGAGDMSVERRELADELTSGGGAAMRGARGWRMHDSRGGRGGRRKG